MKVIRQLVPVLPFRLTRELRKDSATTLVDSGAQVLTSAVPVLPIMTPTEFNTDLAALYILARS